MGTIGLAGFAHRHSLALPAGWFWMILDGGDTASVQTPPRGTRDVWGSPGGDPACSSPRAGFGRIPLKPVGRSAIPRLPSHARGPEARPGLRDLLTAGPSSRSAPRLSPRREKKKKNQRNNDGNETNSPVASTTPETAKPPVKASGGGWGAPKYPRLRGCVLLLAGKGWNPRVLRDGKRGTKAPVPEPPPNPKEALPKFLPKSFCGEETSFLHTRKPSNSFLCCGQATFSAPINHCPRSSPLARACRRPGTVPAGFGTSSDSGEICKTIFINNIRDFIFNNPVCKAKRGLSGVVVVEGGEAARLPKILQRKVL